ncbi:2OG-Fe(II) oxygenase [Derxia gummosa]|uniref:2OG-Fe(II) oxygenase n=1 Tax=Derxia gummosa DSM 723 TaxID=1121388 RepID=A0A8B6X6G6_9BURK|nr:2OG-Fe(II) oxygenase [Derxia gummosa]
MSAQTLAVSHELKSWLDSQIARGCTAASLIDAMVKSGHPRPYAERVVRGAAGGEAVVDEGSTADDGAFSMMGEGAAQAPNTLVVGEREVQVMFALAAPRTVMFGDFLTADECDRLVELSRSKIKPSLVVDPGTGDFVPDAARTSEGTYFNHAENPLVSSIEARIEQMFGFEPRQQEPMQILRYGVGAEYSPHFDYFNVNEAGGRRQLERGGQRVATLIMYLNEVEAGGATVFPSIGLEVKPRKGCALYFESLDDAENVDPRTLHGGAPVGKGEKWIATKWIRERAYV